MVQTSNELDTPSDTPRIHALRSGVFARACDAGKRIKTKQVHRYRPDVYGFSAGNIVDVGNAFGQTDEDTIGCNWIST